MNALNPTEAEYEGKKYRVSIAIRNTKWESKIFPNMLELTANRKRLKSFSNVKILLDCIKINII